MEDGTVDMYYPEDYETEFDGKAYLEHFYSGPAMSHGNRISLFVLPNFAEVIRKTTPDDKKCSLLDVGAGPTIYSALCFRNVVSKIYLSDYLDSNLSILNEWMDKRNEFDWLPVIKTIARNEGLLALPKVFEKVEEDARSVVKSGGILHANVHSEQVLGANQNVNSSQQFDILVSIFCLESACSNMIEYKNALKNMIKLLRPGGTLILGSVIDDDNYISGYFQDKPKLFSLLNLTEKSILNALEDLASIQQCATLFVKLSAAWIVAATRFATFRGNSFAPPHSYQQRQPYYSDFSPTSYKKKPDKTDYRTDYDLHKANEQFKKMLEDGGEAGIKDAKSDPSESHEEQSKSPKEEKSKSEKQKDRDPSTEEIAEMLNKAAIRGSMSAPLYDKTNSFFDDISCESKEKIEGSYNPREWNGERRRNQQTFGMTDRHPSQYQQQRPRSFYPAATSRGFYPPRKLNNERSRNQQTFGFDAAYESYGGHPGGYLPRKRTDYGGYGTRF